MEHLSQEKRASPSLKCVFIWIETVVLKRTRKWCSGEASERMDWNRDEGEINEGMKRRAEARQAH